MCQRFKIVIHLIFFLTLVFPPILFPQQILITEIMYDLDGADSPNEFVELFIADPPT